MVFAYEHYNPVAGKLKLCCEKRWIIPEGPTSVICELMGGKTETVLIF